VGTLLLDADQRIPGGADAAGEANPEGSDVLDDLAEAALRTGAEVIVLPADRMPSKPGAAAVFRY